MRRRIVGLVAVVAVVAGLAYGIGAATTTRFPGALYTYSRVPVPIRESDFSALAREVQAIEAWLGTNGRKVPSVDTRCAYVEYPMSSQLIAPVGRAAYAATITEIYCKRTGGTSTTFDLEVDDGSPGSIIGSPTACTPAGVTISALNGDTSLGTGDRLQLRLGTVVANDQADPVTSIGVCWTFVPV